MADTVVPTTTNVIIDPSTLPAGPERAAAMVAAYNERHAPATELESEAPEGVPAKFWDKTTGQINTAALLASYKALETRQATTTPAVGVTPPATVPGAADGVIEARALQVTTAPTAAEGDAIAATVTAAGLDPHVLQSEIITSGKLSDASVTALKAAGVPEPLIAAHTATVKEMIRLQSEANTALATTYAGGDEQLGKMLGWAKDNLNEADKVAINKLLAGPDWRFGIDSLKTRSGAASRTAGEPSLMNGTGGGVPPVQGYRSVSERTADMNKPAYRQDPAFRAMVGAKMAISKYELDR